MPGTWYGANAPFIGGQNSVLTMQIDEKLIRNDLLQLLLTSPGERVMRPDFGTGIRTFVFENMTSDSLAALQQNILDAIAKWEPRVTATSVTLQSDDDNNLLRIKVYAFFRLDIFSQVIVQQSFLLVELGLPFNALGKVPAGQTLGQVTTGQVVQS